jgi:hypothetical protein
VCLNAKYAMLVLLSVALLKSFYAEGHSIECHYVECSNAERHYSECQLY